MDDSGSTREVRFHDRPGPSHRSELRHGQ